MTDSGNLKFSGAIRERGALQASDNYALVCPCAMEPDDQGNCWQSRRGKHAMDLVRPVFANLLNRRDCLLAPR
jgi:hypothetical protein